MSITSADFHISICLASCFVAFLLLSLRHAYADNMLGHAAGVQIADATTFNSCLLQVVE